MVDFDQQHGRWILWDLWPATWILTVPEKQDSRPAPGDPTHLSLLKWCHEHSPSWWHSTKSHFIPASSVNLLLLHLLHSTRYFPRVSSKPISKALPSLLPSNVTAFTFLVLGSHLMREQEWLVDLLPFLWCSYPGCNHSHFMLLGPPIYNSPKFLIQFTPGKSFTISSSTMCWKN